MTLKDYLENADPEALAKAAGTKRVYLTHLAYGHRKASVKLAQRIVAATRGRVSLSDLRPDIWKSA